MVWFNCDKCGDTVKKPKLDNHIRQCGSWQFACVDCLVTFDRQGAQGHSVCVTEHEKYALGATKPGGFAAAGYTNPNPAPGQRNSEPTGLEFLSSRAPWKCSICNVNCTSQDTLLGHAAGAKHMRRARAALAAANGSKTAGTAAEASAPAAPVPPAALPAGQVAAQAPPPAAEAAVEADGAVIEANGAAIEADGAAATNAKKKKRDKEKKKKKAAQAAAAAAEGGEDVVMADAPSKVPKNQKKVQPQEQAGGTAPMDAEGTPGSTIAQPSGVAESKGKKLGKKQKAAALADEGTPPSKKQRGSAAVASEGAPTRQQEAAAAAGQQATVSKKKLVASEAEPKPAKKRTVDEGGHALVKLQGSAEQGAAEAEPRTKAKKSKKVADGAQDSAAPANGHREPEVQPKPPASFVGLPRAVLLAQDKATAEKQKRSRTTAAMEGTSTAANGGAAGLAKGGANGHADAGMHAAVAAAEKKLRADGRLSLKKLRKVVEKKLGATNQQAVDSVRQQVTS